MATTQCACGGKTTPCFVVITEPGKPSLHNLECHGMKKNLGFSVHTAKVHPHVCVSCGTISLVSEKPEIFAEEVGA